MQNEPNTQTLELEVIPPNALEAITRGEIDCQITTAHKFPRSMTSFKRRATEMACIDQETAESCIYVRPVGKSNGKMQYAEGLSVRMAEIVGASYGNLRVGSMIVEQTDRYVVVRGYAHDLETNFASSSEVKEPTVTKEGRPFTEGMRAVIAKAALSKARRDATFQVVPKALCRPIEKAARQLIAGDAKSFTDRKAAAIQYIQRINVDQDRIWAALGVAGEDDLTSDTLLTLTGIRQAIKDGDTTVDEAFPMVAQAVKAPPRGLGAKASAAPAPEPEKKAGPKPEPKVEPSAKDQSVRQIIEVGKAAGVSGAAVLIYLQRNGVAEGCYDLAEVGAGDLQLLIDGWDDSLPAIREIERNIKAGAAMSKAAAEDAAPGAEPEPENELIAAIRQKLAETGIKENTLISHLKEKKLVTSKSTVDLTGVNEGRQQWVLDHWQELEKAMQGGN